MKHDSKYEISEKSSILDSDWFSEEKWEEEKLKKNKEILRIKCILSTNLVWLKKIH